VRQAGDGSAEMAGPERSAVYPMLVCDEHFEASRIAAGTDPG
jgi:hypothetical protein